MKLNQNWKIIFTILAIVFVFFLLWYLRSIIGYALIAVVLSFIGDPVCQLLKRVRYKKFFLPAWFRAAFTMLLMIGVVFFVGRLFTPLIKEEINLISQIDPHDVGRQLEEKIGLAQGEYVFYGDNGEELDLTEMLISKAQGVLNLSWVQSIFGNVFGFISSFFLGLFAVLFMTFFFLKDGFLFTRIVFTLTPQRHLEKMKNIMEHTHKLLGRFFIGICIQSLIMAVMIGLSLHLLGVRNAILIGLFAGIVNVIPYIGPLLGAGFGILIALTTSLHLEFETDLLPLLIKILIVFVAAQQIDGFLVQPFVLGSSVKAHPLEIFVVVLAAGIIGGILGMVIAIPAYTVLRVVAKEFLSEFKIVESLTRDLTDE